MSDEKETQWWSLINPKHHKTLILNFNGRNYTDRFLSKDNKFQHHPIDPREGKNFEILPFQNRIDEHIADYSRDYTKLQNWH
jgi:peptidyl-prolyl cis-trans isomerase SurA